MTRASRGDAEPATAVVVGCGAIGLPLAVALAARGPQVVGYDTDVAKVADLRRGHSAAMEEGLSAALCAALGAGALSFATDLAPTGAPRAFIIAVPTPAEAGGYDGGNLESAMEAIAVVAAAGDLVCVRSTVPIGATRALSALHPQFAFAACPDRTLSGRAFVEQFAVPQIVGGVDAAAADAAEALFAQLGAVVRVRDAETAEAIKLFANVQRDVSFALANQFALVCEATGLSLAEIAEAGARGYARFDLPRPGPVGGPCLTKDVHVLAASLALAGADLDLLLAARRLNESLAPRLAADILGYLSKTPGPVAILGLAFKGSPPVHDTRGAFAGALERALRASELRLDIRRWDPGCASELGPILEGAAIVVLANDHPALPGVMADVARLAPTAAVFDVSGVLGSGGSHAQLRRFGEGQIG